MKLAKLALLCLALGANSQSYAAKIFTISGIVSPDGNGGSTTNIIGTPYNLGASPWITSFVFSRPVSGILTVGYELTFRELDGHGNETSGNEIDGEVSGTISNSHRGVVRIPHFFPSKTPFHDEYLRWTDPTIALAGLSSPVNFTINGFSGAPEPATWSLMILGFGAIGATIRRRGKVSTGSLVPMLNG